MRGLLGLLLLATGVYVGSYVYFPVTLDGRQSIVESTHLLLSLERDVIEHNTTYDTPSNRTFSPDRQLIYRPSPVKNNRPQLVAAPKLALERTLHVDNSSISPKPITRQRPKAEGKNTNITSPWTTVITTAPRHNSSSRLTSSRPADGAARYALIRDIQSELKRVGCYYGKIDGNWGPASKRAIIKFIAEVNASLPTQNPDFILLSLVQSQQTNVCGSKCAPGHYQLANGQCSPRATIAQNKKKPTIPTTTASIGKAPKPTLVSEWRKVAAAPTSEPNGSLTSPTMPTAAYRTPLPGRMTVGGPKPTRLTAYERNQGVGTLPPATEYADQDSVREPAARRPVKVKRRKLPRTKTKSRSVAKKKARSRRASRSRKRYRARRSNPLRNLLTQGVY